MEASVDKTILITILIAALGYFVDVFDLLLFSVVRVPSLTSLGLTADRITSTGVLLIDIQMAGILAGGLLWGSLGDRFGRKQVLFGSILLYSVANIANGFAHGVNTYAACRFIAGIGLAGELGAGVTLASELLPRAWRGLGTAFIAGIGVLGAVVAVLVSHVTDWRTAYIIGGCIGLVLLVLRVNVRESGLYEKLMRQAPDIARGRLRLLFGNAGRLRRFAAVILVGAPIWCVIGLFITFTPEFAKALGVTAPVSAGSAVLCAYAGQSVGAAFTGTLSQKLRSRRKVLALMLALLAVNVVAYATIPYGNQVMRYNIMCGLLGFTSGYWTMFIQLGAEQFGTNIRATAATSAPNFVRALTIPMTLAFHALSPHIGVVKAGTGIMAVLIVLAFSALITLRETFGEDLDYVEA